MFQVVLRARFLSFPATIFERFAVRDQVIGVFGQGMGRWLLNWVVVENV
jgi:hypothetical protein